MLNAVVLRMNTVSSATAECSSELLKTMQYSTTSDGMGDYAAATQSQKMEVLHEMNALTP